MGFTSLIPMWRIGTTYIVVAKVNEESGEVMISNGNHGRYCYE
jgi:hypothetical protein